MFDALLAGVKAGEDPAALAKRLHAEFPDQLTMEQLASGIEYAMRHQKQQRDRKADDIAMVRDLIARLPHVLARLEATP